MNIATAVLTIISVPGVIALVNLIKTKVDLGKWAALVAFTLGIGLNLAAWAAGAAYTGVDAFTVACIGALVGLGASGIYDQTSGAKVENITAPEVPVLEPGDMPIISIPGGISHNMAEELNAAFANPLTPTVVGGFIGGARIIGIQKAPAVTLASTFSTSDLFDKVEPAGDAS